MSVTKLAGRDRRCVNVAVVPSGPDVTCEWDTRASAIASPRPRPCPPSPVVLPPAAVDHRGMQVAIAAQRCLHDNTVGNLGAVTMFDRVLDELGHRVNDIGDVRGVGADLRQPFAKPGAHLACGV